MYVKLFSSLYQGTLRGRSDEILVFTNLLAHADMHGIVDKHWKAISEETGLSRERVEAAILNLESPDPESRSPEVNGCRIVKMDEHRAWGWNIINYGKYRAIRNEDDRREQNRLAQERFRNKHSKQSKPRKPPSSQAEAEAEAYAEGGKPLVGDIHDWLPKKEWNDYKQHRREINKPLKPTGEARLLQQLESWNLEGRDLKAILTASVVNGWQGLFPDRKNGKTAGNNAAVQEFVRRGNGEQ